MATFYPQPLLDESLYKQWQRYLQNKPLINNIEDIVQTQTKDYKNIIEHSSAQQIQAIQQSTDAVCGTLNSGFELLSENLQDISYGLSEVRSELNSMSSMLDWKLSLFIEQQRISNLLLGNIAILLRIPDIQKERQYYIEQGIKFLKNSYFDDDFYEDALKNLLKAEVIEPSDFFALHRIGLIYMYSPKHLDLKKSEEYFRKAAKYAVAETNAGALITTNYLSGSTSNELSSQIPTIDSIKLQAAESYMFAARSCYIQGKFVEAAELADKSFKIVPHLVEAGFTQVKALSADNKISQAVIVLNSVIEKDRFYSIKTVTDLDLISKPEIKNLIEKLRQQAFNDASDLLSQCKKNMIIESMAQEEINYIEKLINKKSFLHCKKAIDLINRNRIRIFSQIFQTSNKENYKENRHLNELPNIITTINQKVKYPDSYVSTINNLFSFLFDNTQWTFPKLTSLSGILNFNNGYEPKKITSSLIIFTQKEKEYFDKLPSVKIEVQKINRGIYIDDDIRRNSDEIAYAEHLVKVQKAKNKSSMNYAFNLAITYGGIGALIGGFLGGISGCTSCLNNYHQENVWITHYNLFTGLFYGAIIAALIGALIGALVGWCKGQE